MARAERCTQIVAGHDNRSAPGVEPYVELAQRGNCMSGSYQVGLQPGNMFIFSGARRSFR
jgi:hypothetical protein